MKHENTRTKQIRAKSKQAIRMEEESKRKKKQNKRANNNQS